VEASVAKCIQHRAARPRAGPYCGSRAIASSSNINVSRIRLGWEIKYIAKARR
jgi:hypothetical protein